MRRLAAVVAMIVGCLLLFGCGTAVPKVTGTSLEQASETISAAGFGVGPVSYDIKSGGREGLVARQTPAPGDRAKAGSAITIVIAGLPPVTTPSVLGLDRDALAAALASASLVLGSVSESYDTSASVGAVISQEPTPGAVVPNGSPVTVLVSKGPAPVSVPKVIGKSELKARTALGTAGFKVKKTNKDSSSPKGTVLAQSPGAGKLVVPGAAVSITVSTGIQMVRVPKVYGLVWEEASRKVAAAGLSPKVLESVNPQGPIYVGEFSVYKQQPAAGMLVPKGSNVSFWYWWHDPGTL